MSEFLQTMAAEAHWMLAMCVLVLGSAFFSSCETALFYLSHDELRAFRMGRPRERVVAQLLSQPDRLLSAVLFWNLIINLTYFAVSIIVAHQLANSGHKAAAGAFGLVSVFGIILLGEVLPEKFRRRISPAVGEDGELAAGGGGACLGSDSAQAQPTHADCPADVLAGDQAGTVFERRRSGTGRGSLQTQRRRGPAGAAIAA